MTAVLYLVATPIGNLEDITLRAIRTLKEVDLIACEDTRRTKILLNHYAISKELVSYHSYSQNSKTDFLIENLLSGKNVAYVTDGGTPGISDPGEELVREALKNNITVESIPGPSALISALVCSGLPANGFIFLGFLQRKPGKIKKALKKAAELEKTIIFYESPFRIVKTIRLCKEIFAEAENTRCVIARELTKKFEEIIRGTLSEVYDDISQRKEIKGEIVALINPKNKGKENERD
ncbi:MAG: 16S rRNA (cytidine(1402)-2'-O)-methyltransferase [Elusimicrobia bacterium]|nr:16S rRNA (cytidine(1402)-2'-O)-methyltransferase [Elusimicrobiota bacterium]MBU2614714.1 16S rRNA (cytidine(1402)-2'-O)-methyltransferase [Elusimicrobiota bacterium]